MDGVDAVRLGPPDLRRAETPRVAAPGRPGPARALVEELGVYPYRGGDAGGVRALEFDAPAAVDGPAGDEVVVFRVERTDAAEGKVFVNEAGAERWVCQDGRAVG